MGDTNPSRPPRLVIVSNRLAVTLKKKDGKYISEPSSGGLVSSLSGISNTTDMRWFGWPGMNIEDPEERKVANAALAENNAVGIFLEEELAHSHYNVFSNGIAWPILHYQSGVGFYEDAWVNYQKVNNVFAETVADAVCSGDKIWVHDYHLFLVPRLLREKLQARGKKCPIGFTLHTPFPVYDFCRALPVQDELLNGMLGADVLGFHTDGYRKNFIESCEEGLDAKRTGDDIEYDGHKAHTGTFIVGIDPRKFTDCLQTEETKKRIEEMRKIYDGKTVILGVDRLDYTKGLVQKLQGYDQFLREHPELKGKVVLIQVAIPSREDVKEYKELKDQLHQLVGEISGHHSTADGSPIAYMHHAVEFTDLASLYRIADICLINARRDGMNLVAAEYVACQKDKHGVLVMSKFTGAATFMHKGSIMFHPSSALQLSDALYEALTMEPERKKKMYQELEDFVYTNTSAEWGAKFTKALESAS
ncbi:glycosyl transferase [Aspergillus unguis]